MKTIFRDVFGSEIRIRRQAIVDAEFAAICEHLENKRWTVALIIGANDAQRSRTTNIMSMYKLIYGKVVGIREARGDIYLIKESSIEFDATQFKERLTRCSVLTSYSDN